MGYQEDARELVQHLSQRISPSLYDAAWMLRLQDQLPEKGSRDLLLWILNSQQSDGSWGADIRYYHHDRIICTLISAIALAEAPRTARIQSAIDRAEVYLWQHAHMLFRDPALTELVGFELVFPTLMKEARCLGLHLPAHYYGITDLKNEKLRLIPPEMLYSRNLTTVHSLEFLGTGVSAGALHNAVFENGSLGNSPATTAYYLHVCEQQGVDADPAAAGYLERVRESYPLGCCLYPFRNFEVLWVLNNLALVDPDFLSGFAPDSGSLGAFQARLEEGGVGLDDEFGIPDADCTSVAYFLLGLAGQSPPDDALQRFEVPGAQIFRTYDFERNPSISTNIHALEALRVMPDYPNRTEVMENIRRMLFENRRFKLFWTDKWHASPFYATAYALISLLEGPNDCSHFCRDTIDWIVHAQRPDGSWGFFDRGTMEETAYALLALQRAHRLGQVPDDVLKKGAAYLLAGLDSAPPARSYVPLWLGKCLYSPYDIVHSAVLAALIQQEVLFGTAG